MSDFIQVFKNPRNYFLCLLAGLLVFNTFDLTQRVYRAQKLKKIIPFYFQGLKFAGLEDIFKNVQVVGYYTDQDLNNSAYSAQFAQAQYVVAPVILDLNYAGHPYILFDCSSEEKAMNKIKELKAIPLRRNTLGVILAIQKP